MSRSRPVDEAHRDHARLVAAGDRLRAATGTGTIRVLRALGVVDPTPVDQNRLDPLLSRSIWKLNRAGLIVEGKNERTGLRTWALTEDGRVVWAAARWLIAREEQGVGE
jgi:hypothetical protein